MSLLYNTTSFNRLGWGEKEKEHAGNAMRLGQEDEQERLKLQIWVKINLVPPRAGLPGLFFLESGRHELDGKYP